MMFKSRAQRFAEIGNFCDFGLVSAPLAAFLATDVGLGAGLAGGIATGLTGAAVGAAGGAGLSAIEGKPIGKGALEGGIAGGAIGGLGPVLGSAGEAAGLPASVASTAGDVAAGLGGGLAGAAVTGQPLLTGAESGAAGGLVSGVLGAGTATPSPGASAVPVGGTAGAGASPAAAALGGGGISPTGDLAGPAGLPAGTPNVNFGLTDQPVGPGVIGSAGAGGGAGTPLAGPGVGVNQDFSGGLDAGASSGLPTGGTDTGGGGINSIVDKLTSNPAALIGAGGLGLAALRQNQPLPEQAQLNQIGAQAQATGNQLASYVNTGTLPPGAQESVNLATNAAKAQVRSTAAQLGLSGSTWEADRMAQIDQQTAAQSEQIAQQLLSQGANYSQLSTGVFENLMKSTLAQDQQFQQALSTFAAGLAGAKTSGT